MFEESRIVNDCDEDGDRPQLSEFALAALQEFYQEQSARAGELESSKGGVASDHIPENWQLSQFWYSDDTATILAEECIRASNNGRIACISCPTLYKKLLDTLTDSSKVVLLEYDKRFALYGEAFVYYDYNHPLDLPHSLEKNSFDVVAVDPPYLSEECLTSVSLTVKHLTKEKVLLCTGSVMEELAARLLGVKLCQGFSPHHACNLGNDFRCYVNYKSQLS